RQDLATIRAGKKPGKWLSKAAWSAVISRAELAGDSQPQKSKEARGNAATQTGAPAQRPLTPEEMKLADACLLYLDVLPDGQHAARGTRRADLTRVEEQSAYTLADGVAEDEGKARALLDFVDKHPGGSLTDKAIFGAAAALSRTGRVDDALAARSRLWKETPSSELVPRALLASADDHNAVGDFGDAASLLEKYFQGYRREVEGRKWRRAHTAPSRKQETAPLYDEARAQAALHHAAGLP